jgi:pimeloyl-ACP methyl ester carboxylesterase
MTEFADIDGGRIAYDVTGQGPLVVLSHGIGDRRQAYRFLAPRLAQAGYRVANADLRGHGESSMGWPSVTGKQAISRTDVAGDLLALIRHLGGPAVIAGQSISGGAATIAAATEPELVSGIVEINPFTQGPEDRPGRPAEKPALPPGLHSCQSLISLPSRDDRWKSPLSPTGGIRMRLFIAGAPGHIGSPLGNGGL